MLYFKKDELEVCEEKAICHVCRERRATWAAQLRDSDVRWNFCAWCLMYSNQSQWGYDNREEMLHVGRHAVGMAAKHRKEIPATDKRDRLLPADAEKFMMGVSFTSRMLIDRMGMSRKKMGVGS